MNSLEKLILGGEEESVDQQCFINHDFHCQRFSFRQYIPARIAALGNMRSVPNFVNKANRNRSWSIFQRPLLLSFLLRPIAGRYFVSLISIPLWAQMKIGRLLGTVVRGNGPGTEGTIHGRRTT